jgi:hypothetical protein
MNTVTCGFCREHFKEDYGQRTCGSCPMKGGCSFVRCPHCGFENPMTPPWMLRLRSWLRSDAAQLLHENDTDEVLEGAVLR